MAGTKSPASRVFWLLLPVVAIIGMAPCGTFANSFIGTVTMTNKATGPLNIHCYAFVGPAVVFDYGNVDVPETQVDKIDVQTAVRTVYCDFRVTLGSGKLIRRVLVYCPDLSHYMPVVCGFDCLWNIDDGGISVFNPDTGVYELVERWIPG